MCYLVFFVVTATVKYCKRQEQAIERQKNSPEMMIIVILMIAVHCIASVALLFEARCLNVWLFTRVEYDKSFVSV